MPTHHLEPSDNTSWMARLNFNTVMAVLFILLWSVMFCIIPMQIQKPMLFMGRSLMGLEPNLFPRMAIMGLIVLNIWFFIISFRIEEKNLFKEVARDGYFRVFATLVVFAAYALLFEPLGFVLSSFLVAASLSTYYGNRNVLIGIFISVGIPLGIYFVFTRLLAVSLPEFPFFSD